MSAGAVIGLCAGIFTILAIIFAGIWKLLAIAKRVGEMESKIIDFDNADVEKRLTKTETEIDSLSELFTRLIDSQEKNFNRFESNINGRFDHLEKRIDQLYTRGDDGR
jgi:septation ring formation regulator EzrA